MNPILEALAMLTPFDIDSPKIRVGPNSDGGYVLVNDFSPSQTVVSYGVGTEYRFEAEMAERGHEVRMFDPTIRGISASNERMIWLPEGVSGFTDATRALYSIEDHLRIHKIDGDRLLLKMDVEGAEFDALGNASDEVLRRFDQVVVEVHGLEQLQNGWFRQMFVKMFTKLNRHFTLFHVHANNCEGPDSIRICGGFPLTSIIELSYIRSSRTTRRPSRTLYPTCYDYPNTSQRDKLLWFFPFSPTGLSISEFSLCEERVTYLEELRLAGRDRN